MQDEYAFLRAQCEAILEHCDYLLHFSVDPEVLLKANACKQQAHEQLQRLNRQATSMPGSMSSER